MRSRLHAAASAFAILVAAFVAWAVIIAPCLDGYPVGDSYYFNTAWIALFADQVAGGDFYPRWLTDFSGELGAPIFYFYAPAPFYLAAAANLLTGGEDFQATLLATNILLYALSASSFTMFARSFAGWRTAFICGAFYAVLPYHVIDIEVRGALGEAAAYVFTPLVLFGLQPAQDGGRRRVIGALGYAGLILSHLPSAVLFTAALCVFTATQTNPRNWRANAASLAFIGVTGALAAAVYLLPALSIRAYLTPEGWLDVAGPYFYPENWLLFGPTRLGPDADRVRLGFTVAQAISTGLALLSLGAFALMRMIARPATQGEASRGLAIGAGAALLFSWLMMTEVATPAYRHIDILRMVQFPWRGGVVIDVMSATLGAVAASRMIALQERMPDRRFAAAILAAGAIMVICIAGVLSSIGGAVGAIPRTRDHHRSLATEVALLQARPANEISPERLFAEYPGEYRSRWIAQSRAYGLMASDGDLRAAHAAAYERWRAAVIDQPSIRVDGAAGDGAVLSLNREGPTRFRIAADLPAAATIRLRRIYFPNWRLFDARSGAAIALRASEDDGLMAFDLPAGTHDVVLKSVPLPAEIIGGWISGVTLVMLLAMLFQRRAFSRVTWPILRPGEASRLP